MNEENYLKRRPYVSVILIVLAFIVISLCWLIFMTIGMIYYATKNKLTKYIYNVGVSIDYLLASIIFGTKGHTISAIVYKRKYCKTVASINWIFRDKNHCKSSYEKEYKRRKKNNE